MTTDIGNSTSASEIGDKLWVLEFSQSQKAFNTQLLKHAVKYNRDAFLRGEDSDYGIIAVSTDKASLSRLVEALDVRNDRSIPFTRTDIAAIRERLRKAGDEGNEG